MVGGDSEKTETPDAALGEAFQVDRTIDRELDRPYLTGFSFTRLLTVLDLAADSVGAWVPIWAQS